MGVSGPPFHSPESILKGEDERPRRFEIDSPPLFETEWDGFNFVKYRCVKRKSDVPCYPARSGGRRGSVLGVRVETLIGRSRGKRRVFTRRKQVEVRGPELDRFRLRRKFLTSGVLPKDLRGVKEGDGSSILFHGEYKSTGTHEVGHYLKCIDAVTGQKNR